MGDKSIKVGPVEIDSFQNELTQRDSTRFRTS